MTLTRSFTFLLSLTAFTACVAGPVQSPSLVLPPSAADHRQAVKDIFQRSYNAYRKFAFGHDDLEPLSGRFNDGRNGWGASIVDAMPTMFIMGFDDFFNEALTFVGNIDFSKSQTPDTVSVFETTIRYLGGLLSAYELSGQNHGVLLDKAKQVADKMAFAWKQPNRIPYGNIDFSTNTPTVGLVRIAYHDMTWRITEIPTLLERVVSPGLERWVPRAFGYNIHPTDHSTAILLKLDLEWATLTKHTGNDTYRSLAEGTVRTIAAIPPPLPGNVERYMLQEASFIVISSIGLAARTVDPATNKFTDRIISWGGSSDSYFEYLIKYARLTNTNDNLFADTWATAVDSSIRFLLRISTVGDHVYLADQDGSGNIIGVGSHLACFNGGNWIYGGRLLNNETIFRIGLDLTEACWNTYASTQTGIGPEVFRYVTTNKTDSSNNATLTPEQRTFYEKHGFYITGADYILRPEVLESNFYAWRATGDTKYLDRAASAIESFNTHLLASKTGGYAGLNNVNNVTQGLIDDTESFWFAEVLKYLYLTFDDPNHISLDEFVFNTEAQPFIAPQGKGVYGSGRLVSYTEAFSPTSISAPSPKVSPSKFFPEGVSDGF
ncbi:hypothetical protein E1B28_011804 [Marasmius oreades]|uniref:alpha-1,2-Mannosidase n=1 Tax=Marasmius oreades TaxID=181124 RepID=A0A9P7UQL9_9AGAR|nr:uncharacterized protein E1B28_011804 [Marasmius oreades]KAG7090200.1 hypothetical protein E1B28_011804 [Marasmius oreades]